MEGSAPTLRVLLWAPRGAGEHYNGPGSFAYRLYSTAPQQYFRITLVHGYRWQGNYSVFADQQLLSVLENAFHLPRFLWTARWWLSEHAREFDVFHGLSGYHATVSPAVQAERYGLPAVVFLANHRQELAHKPGVRGLLGLARRRREMIKRISAIIAMSQAIAEELLEYGVPEGKIARIPMGVNTDRFRPAATEAERAELRAALGWRDLPTVAFVGAITERKRPHLLVEAAALLKARGVECQVVFAGPPQQQGYVDVMMRRIDELGLRDHVVWMGMAENIDVVYRASDVFALPSAREGMPAALVEAMASGLPSVVTKISGTADLIQDGEDGRFVDPQPEEVADGINFFLTDPARRALAGARARAKVVARYSATAVLDAYRRLFLRLARGGDAAE